MALSDPTAPAHLCRVPALLRPRAWQRITATIGLLAALAVADAADAFPGKPAPGDPRAKIDALLRRTLDTATSAPGIGLGRRLSAATPVHASDDTVVVRLDASTGQTELDAIRATGATVRSVSPRWNSITVEADAAQIEALARLPAVAAIVLPRQLRHHAQPGTVVNQAGAVIHADQLTTATGINGSGQKIGLLSDSINLTTTVGAGTTTGSAPFILTGTLPQGRGDLPASIQVIDFGTSSNGQSATDEGEAMMEECYKLAPGAGYAFSSSGALQTDMAANIGFLDSQSHCTIIADDIGFFDEPMFQDGPIAQAANAFVAGGGIYLSAFGNDGNGGILTTYSDVSATVDPHTNNRPNGNDFLDWGIGGAKPGFLELDVSGAATLTITLQWNEPYHSYNLGSGASSDYDLYLYSDTTPSSTSSADIVDASIDSQGPASSPAGDPLEIIQHTFTGSGNHRVFLAVDRFSGAAANVLRLVINCDRTFTSPTPAVFNGPAGFGHPVASGVLGIAAARFSTPNVPESFTSRGGLGSGGIPFFFDTAGNLLSGAPVHRDKPELTAPDGVATSNSTFNPFFGTSAATPNAAASAALVWSAFPTATNQQVKARLLSTAIDITGGSASTGIDVYTGVGMVDALRAAGIPVTGIDTTASDGLHESGTIPVQVTFASAVTVTGTPTLLLNTTPPRSASFASGSGTATLTFSYAIVPGDASSHLDVASAAALDLSSATITGTGTAVPILQVLPVASASGALAANSNVVIDATGPATTITASPAAGNTPGFVFIITFAQAVTGFDLSDLTVTNGTPGALSGSGASYSLPVTATTTGAVIVAAAAGAALDAAGLGNHAASGSATFNLTPPTLVITPAQASVVSGQAVSITFTFSEAVTGFVATSVDVVGGTRGALSGSGAIYTMDVTAGAAGTLTISVSAGAPSDLAGNPLATGATTPVTVTSAPATSSSSSSHSCGFGGLFSWIGMLGMLALMARGRGHGERGRR